MALVVASGQGRLALVRSMLERGADVNFVFEEKDCTPLFAASQGGHLAIVDIIYKVIAFAGGRLT